MKVKHKLAATLLTALVSSALPALAQDAVPLPEAPKPVPPPQLPDLSVRSVRVSLGENCAPFKPVLLVSVEICNNGRAASPSRKDVGVLQVQDTDGSGWANGRGLPGLAPGDCDKFIVPLYYPTTDPGHILGTHKLMITLNQGRWFEESNTANNSFGPVEVTVPREFCEPQTRPAPAPGALAAVEATVRAEPIKHQGPCPGFFKFTGRITANGKGTIKYKFLRSDGAIMPLREVYFKNAGTKEVDMKWQLGDVTLPHYAGWVAIQIAAPNEMTTAKTNFDLVCTDARPAPAVATPPITPELNAVAPHPAKTPAPAAPAAQALADLQVKLSVPSEARAGDIIGAAIEVHAMNYGAVAVAGTADEVDPANGYVIEIFLSADKNIAPGVAAYKPNFAEDVLLQGGRINHTYDLPPGAAAVYEHLQNGKGKIPDDTPPGVYFIGARIDPANKVAESDENNNIAWGRIAILAKGTSNARPVRDLPVAP
ncbi:MAG TPA: hypothetical protein VNA16_04385 [Abditibacteriaceae bacterium]|nr:hypothetical protein [Abditibacteriaceae bacterium]